MARQIRQCYRIEKEVTNNHINVSENNKEIPLQIKCLSVPNAGKNCRKREFILKVEQIRTTTLGEQFDSM